MIGFILGVVTTLVVLLWLARPKRLPESDTTGWLVREWYKLGR